MCYKVILNIFTSILSMLFIPSLVYAANNTQDSTQLAQPPSVTPAAAFILDQGSQDFTATPGSYWLHIGRKACPSNFIPYVVLTPLKWQSPANGWNNICVLDGPNPYGNGYAVKYGVSSISPISSAPITTAIAFNWTIYCYPSSTPPPAQQNGAENGYVTDHCLLPSDVTGQDYNLPQYVLATGGGYVDSDARAGQPTYFTATVPLSCPQSYKACVVPALIGTNNVDSCSFQFIDLNANITNSGSGYNVSITNSKVATGSNCYDRGLYFSYTVYCVQPSNVSIQNQAFMKCTP